MKVCRLLVSFTPAPAGDLRRNGTEQKKEWKNKENKGEKENHAPPVVPAPPDTVVIKSPLCMAAFSLLEKLYNVPLEMSLVMGVWFIMGRVPFEKQFP